VRARFRARFCRNGQAKNLRDHTGICGCARKDCDDTVECSMQLGCKNRTTQYIRTFVSCGAKGLMAMKFQQTF
jgi:hypothetical protein